MRTWVLYKRKNLLGKQEITFGVDILKGRFDEVRKIFAATLVSGPETERTIASGKSPADLAKLVATNSTIKGISRGELVVSLERTIFVPGNKYIDIPATPEEVREFYEVYEKLTSDA